MIKLPVTRPSATTPFGDERKHALMVDVSIPMIVITVIVLLIVLGLLYLALQSEGEGELLELAIELID